MITQLCRSCEAANLIEILNLGFAPPSNALLSKKDLSRGETHYPLALLFCLDCKLVQTLDFHPGEALFTPDYPYLSSTSTTWVRHAYSLVDYVIQEFTLSSNSLVAEIASNDGYLLERLNERGIPNYGIEPTELAADISLQKGHQVYNCFLNPETAAKIMREKGPADLVIANNVFAHVPNLNEFAEAAKLLLSEDGILIIEVQYFGLLFKESLFDTIYHEHYSYFTLTSMKYLLQRNKLGVFKVEMVPTHGGSIRVYARNNQPHVFSEDPGTLLYELEQESNRLENLLEFQERVNLKKTNIKKFISELHKNGKIIAGVGAAAKGNTLINFLGLGIDDICYVFDSALSKQGKFLPGSHIPILSLATVPDFREIDVFITLPWNIAEELSNDLCNRVSREVDIYRLLPDIKLLRGTKV